MLRENLRGRCEVAQEYQTRELSTARLPFELFGTAIAERLVQPLAVIEVLDILRDGIAGFGLILKLPMPHHFVLQRTES